MAHGAEQTKASGKHSSQRRGWGMKMQSSRTKSLCKRDSILPLKMWHCSVVEYTVKAVAYSAQSITEDVSVSVTELQEPLNHLFKISCAMWKAESIFRLCAKV
ncbi:hypothetical protein JRQ81_015046 [Phrynocephalus forsythii]|uniref:Uncharacterized protein n=1 Tax=Phrynocephalus forsythii TaxID=171643 RepID=A0A9Q1B3M5_9SAUR|nr:hypothetical protein JRQ81_015046 [Phrynocephalus forsythii]